VQIDVVTIHYSVN